MSARTAVLEEWARFVALEPEDDAMREHQLNVARAMLILVPEVKAEWRAEGVRSVLRRVLARRRLALTAEEEARIDACQEAAILKRWVEQAVDASSAADALR